LKVIKTKHSGYCFGVKRALGIAEDILRKNKNSKIKIFTLGSIIHNSGVTNEMTKKGLISAKKLEQIEPGSIFIIRAHGLSPELLKELKNKDISIVDATCPFVKKAQHRAMELSKNKYFVVIIGNKNHPEVAGIKDHIIGEKYAVVEDKNDTESISFKEKIGVVVQTTQTIEKLRAITNKLIDKTKELLIFNTICNTTKERQNSTRKLARKVDTMIVVGGKNSANTTHLKEISEKCGATTYHIENFKELKPAWFKGIEKIGICGGASTPEKDLTEVIKTIEKI
jgi:(E)-4-hydroxy-3-methyl-but-2-enyl pyrophosphate reductase